MLKKELATWEESRNKEKATIRWMFDLSKARTKLTRADEAYDETPVYDAVVNHSPDANIVIPPQVNAVLNDKAAPKRNSNIIEIAAHGRMNWQKNRQYGQRNLSELGVQRYQRIMGDTMHARAFDRQKQEALIGCGVINKMKSLEMPASYRSA